MLPNRIYVCIGAGLSLLKLEKYDTFQSILLLDAQAFVDVHVHFIRLTERPRKLAHQATMHSERYHTFLYFTCFIFKVK